MGKSLKKQVTDQIGGFTDSRTGEAKPGVKNPMSRRTLKKFVRDRRASGTSWQTILTDIAGLKSLANYFPKKSIRSLRKGEIQKWAGEELMENGYAVSTISRRKLAVKSFYKWAAGGEEFPKKVKWIKTTVPKAARKEPDELLSPVEIRSMVEACDHPRDKAMVAVFGESGARIGEFLGLNLKNARFDKYGAVIRLNPDQGTLKTGTRPIRLIESAPYLQNWVESHPDKHNPEAPLWISLHPKSFGSRLGPDGVRDRLAWIARRAGVKKRVYPHLFRHSRATQLAKEGYSEQDMKILMGWTRDSEMAATYTHMAMADVENKILDRYGLRKPEEKEEARALEPKTCPRCKKKGIEATAMFCPRCSMALTPEAAVEIERARERADAGLDELFEDPEVLRLVRRKWEEILWKRMKEPNSV